MSTQYIPTQPTYSHNNPMIDDEFDGSEFNQDMEIVLHDATTLTFGHEALDL